MAFNKYIRNAGDLVTSHEQTRAGFLKIALEKNRLGDPYIKIHLPSRVWSPARLVRKPFFPYPKCGHFS